jgi:hypothetical protein
MFGKSKIRDEAPISNEHGVRTTLLKAADDLGAPYQELVRTVCQVSINAPLRAKRLNRPRYGLRLLLATAVVGLLGVFSWASSTIQITLERQSPRDLLGVIADSCDCLVLIPLLLSVFYLEARLKRWKILEELKTLEALNDETYELQFNEKPYSSERVEDLIKLLDVCCGVLFLVRKSAGAFSVSSDPVVLERIGVIRRGCNDNHRNILMKVSMAMSKNGKDRDSFLSAA